MLSTYEKTRHIESSRVSYAFKRMNGVRLNVLLDTYNALRYNMISSL